MSLLDQLNEQQRAAVEYCEGPQLVIAGAGSGKTRVLTYKIAYLIEQGLKPWSILALTFTNKAADEMRQRISQLVGEARARWIVMGTFHSVFARILRMEAERTPYTSSFTIYDQSDSQSLVGSIIKEMGVDTKELKASTVLQRISRAKNRLIRASDYPASPWGKLEAQKGRTLTADIYKRYEERLRKANAMDFDDLLLNTYLLFHNHEDIRQKYSAAFDYVLVDEYQDTNSAQQSIVTLLTREKRRICVVGDDAQSIYSFRGAEIENILGFEKTYGGARLFKLETNYRSTQIIVAAANSLIRHNERQIHKEVVSHKAKGEPIKLRMTYSDMEEAMVVAKEIVGIKRREGCEYSDFAILYRINSQSRTFEECLRKQSIPYRIFGGLSFYQRKEIKDAIAYMRLVVNPDDEEALRRIINYPRRGIGQTTIDKIAAAANVGGVSMWQVMGNMEGHALALSKATEKKILEFRQMVETWATRQHDDDAATLGIRILQESGMRDDIMKGREPDDLSRQENIGELVSGLANFVDERRDVGDGDKVAIADFLQEVSLLSDLDSQGDKDEPRVTLTTIHSAKGLEFGTVFIVGLENEIFPSEASLTDPRRLEEERRLMYVALTRAMNHCILTWSRYRMRYGSREFETPSVFIDDIDKRFIAMEGMGVKAESPKPLRRTLWSEQEHFKAIKAHVEDNMRRIHIAPMPEHRDISIPSAGGSSADYKGLSVGSQVLHSRFGQGRVMALEGYGDNAKATVEFQTTGTKQLLLKFARLTKVGD